MGAPQLIPTPTKAYVAINCFSSDKSIPPTLCDLGRVSSIASAVTLPRTSSFVNRNIGTQNTRSLCHKKRPISEVLGDSNSEINQNLSISASAAHSTLEVNSARKNNSTSEAKRTRLESTTSGMVLSPKASKEDILKNISVSMPKEAQRTTRTLQSVNLPLVTSQEPKPEPFRTQHNKILSQNTIQQLPHQQAVLLHAPVFGKLPDHSAPSLTLQLHQQNQQLHSENLILHKQLNLFRQLMKNPQRLNQVLTRLDQSVC